MAEINTSEFISVFTIRGSIQLKKKLGKTFSFSSPLQAGNPSFKRTIKELIQNWNTTPLLQYENIKSWLFIKHTCITTTIEVSFN